MFFLKLFARIVSLSSLFVSCFLFLGLCVVCGLCACLLVVISRLGFVAYCLLLVCVSSGVVCCLRFGVY